MNATLIAQIEKNWKCGTQGGKGCSFEMTDTTTGATWIAVVPPSNKWDVWAHKKGTKGATRKTFARFDVRTDTTTFAA